MPFITSVHEVGAKQRSLNTGLHFRNRIPFPGRAIEKETRLSSVRKCDMGLDFEFRKPRQLLW